MLSMMEKYTNNLETIVNERTRQLQSEKTKTDQLLHKMLPRYDVANLRRFNKRETEPSQNDLFEQQKSN